MSQFDKWFSTLKSFKSICKIQTQETSFKVFIDKGKTVREYQFGPYTNKTRLYKDWNKVIKAYKKEMSKIIWNYDKRTEAYLFGENNLGGGVFQDNNLWYGNSVVVDIVMVGPFSTREEAQLAVEKDYENRKKDS